MTIFSLCDAVLLLQPPKNKQRGGRGKKRKATSNAAAPPEELIDDDRRQAILQVYQEALEKSNSTESGDDNIEDDLASSDELPLSCARKALTKLQLEGIKIEELQKYFGGGCDGDDPIDSLDADMFLRYAAAKTLQREKSDKAFALMDGGQKGVVLIEDLQRVAGDLGEDISEEGLQEMIDFVDSSGEGLLSPRHFFKIARQVNL